MPKLVIPKFASEAEEAQWWDDHRDIVEENLIEAMENGTIRHASETEHGRRAMAAAKRALSVRESCKGVIATLSDGEKERLHQHALAAGMDDETYLQQIFLQALASELKAAFQS